MPNIALRAIRAALPVFITRHLAFALYRHDAIRAITLVRMIGGTA
jgi:hypothetical protein